MPSSPPTRRTQNAEPDRKSLPLVRAASYAWSRAHGRGAVETDPALTPARFTRMSRSQFGTPPPVNRTRTFEVSVSARMPRRARVRVHTSGRRPSEHVFRVLRATIDVLARVYGPYPRADQLEVLLHDDPTPKRFPARGERLAPHHINSGFSVGARIVVLRRAEMHRTLVHELVHVWATHGMDFPVVQKQAHRELGAPPGCLLTESFVECVTWLVHGGFCKRGLDPDHALAVARAYSDRVTGDDGTTNGWAYFVGKALLVADGACRFHAAFFRTSGASGPTPPSVPVRRRLVTSRDHSCLLGLMREARRGLGGIHVPNRTSARIARSPRMCACSLGEPFEREA